MLYGLVLPGAGQFYAARPGEGLAVFGVVVASTVMAIGSCDGSGPIAPQCGGGFGIGATGLLASWIYGMASAPADVRAHNLSLGPPYTLAPFTAPEQRRVGLALSLRIQSRSTTCARPSLGDARPGSSPHATGHDGVAAQTKSNASPGRQ